MIKKYNQYIKEELDHLEIDPYGEEDWDDDNLTPILQISKKQGKPYNQITYLNCSHQNLTNLDGIENLINLKELNCSNNQLTNLDGIENLINLKILYCSFNQLINLNGKENLINLTRLYCYNNNFLNEYKKYIKEYCKKKNIGLII